MKRAGGTRLALVGVLALAACGSVEAVNYGAALPSYGADDYEKVHDRWTRHAHATQGVRKGLDTVLDAHITLVGDDFRAAYLAKVSAMRAYTTQQRAVLATELSQDGLNYLDLIVDITSSSYEWNDLASKTSVWTLTLTDDGGHNVGGPDIVQVEDRPVALAELFPPVTPFTRHWRVRFKRKLPDGGLLAGPGTRSITLRIAGVLANEAVTW